MMKECWTRGRKIMNRQNGERDKDDKDWNTEQRMMKAEEREGHAKVRIMIRKKIRKWDDSSSSNSSKKTMIRVEYKTEDDERRRKRGR